MGSASTNHLNLVDKPALIFCSGCTWLPQSALVRLPWCSFSFLRRNSWEFADINTKNNAVEKEWFVWRVMNALYLLKEVMRKIWKVLQRISGHKIKAFKFIPAVTGVVRIHPSKNLDGFWLSSVKKESVFIFFQRRTEGFANEHGALVIKRFPVAWFGVRRQANIWMTDNWFSFTIHSDDDHDISSNCSFLRFQNNPINRSVCNWGSEGNQTAELLEKFIPSQVHPLCSPVFVKRRQHHKLVGKAKIPNVAFVILLVFTAKKATEGRIQEHTPFLVDLHKEVQVELPCGPSKRVSSPSMWVFHPGSAQQIMSKFCRRKVKRTSLVDSCSRSFMMALNLMK